MAVELLDKPAEPQLAISPPRKPPLPPTRVSVSPDAQEPPEKKRRLDEEQQILSRLVEQDLAAKRVT